MQTAKTLRRLIVAFAAFCMTIAIAGPASASTRLNDAQWGDACGSRTFYATVSADASMDGNSKADLANLAFGGRVDLPSGCPGVTKFCLDATVQQAAAGQIATSTPFGAIGASFASAAAPVVAGKTASQTMTSCWSTSARSFSAAVRVPAENAFVYTGGRYKLNSYTIKSRVRIVVSGATYSSPWASATGQG